jgi:hypothetical protein
MSAHDRYQTALDKTGARRGLGPAWDPKPVVHLKPKRAAVVATKPVSMPRQQRPLFVRDAGFWPTDSAGWALVKALALIDLGLIAFLAFSVWTR